MASKVERQTPKAFDFGYGTADFAWKKGRR